jgi:hypothetical protein
MAQSGPIKQGLLCFQKFVNVCFSKVGNLALHDQDDYEDVQFR